MKRQISAYLYLSKVGPDYTIEVVVLLSIMQLIFTEERAIFLFFCYLRILMTLLFFIWFFLLNL